MGRSRKPLCGQPYRGFESPSLRHLCFIHLRYSVSDFVEEWGSPGFDEDLLLDGGRRGFSLRGAASVSLHVFCVSEFCAVSVLLGDGNLSEIIRL